MGSDLSKPKNRKNKSECSDGTSSNGKRNSRTICYDVPDCYDPCQSVKFAPLQLPPFPRQQPRYPRDPRDMYKDFDPPSDVYDRSAVVSNLQLSPRTSTRKLVCYECPEKIGSLSSSRAPRYKTAKPVLKREDTFGEDDYKESRETRKEPRRYTVVSTTRERERDRDRDRDRERERERDPIYYSEGKNGKIDDYDGIPKDRIYEIRKEKILIKADKSPERYRSKSSEKYLDNKSTDYKSYDDGTGTYKVYEREDGGGSSTRKQLQSRSVYVLKDDRESSPERSSYSERKYSSNNKNSSSKSKTNSNGNGNSGENSSIPSANLQNVAAQSVQVNAPAISSNCNTDIVYVPMVKEDFLKRECKKLENPEQSIKPIKTFEQLQQPQSSKSPRRIISQKEINTALSQTTTTTVTKTTKSTATSPFSPVSKPKSYKKVIISERSFPRSAQNSSCENISRSVPVTYENNLLKIKINQPDPKVVSSPFSNNSNASTLTSTSEFRTPNLVIKKNQLNNNIEISTNKSVRNTASNLIDEIKINLNNNKQNGLVYSRYVYSGKKDSNITDNNNNIKSINSEANSNTLNTLDSNYDSLTEDSAKYVQHTSKLRETSYQIDDLMQNKQILNNQITSFHRF